MKSKKVFATSFPFFVAFLLLAVAAVAISSLWVAAEVEAPYQAQWTQQIGTDQDETNQSVAVDGLGNIYLCGHVRYRSLHESSAPQKCGYVLDGFLAKFDRNGVEIWNKELGYRYPFILSVLNNAAEVSSNASKVSNITADELGNVYICGHVFPQAIAASVTSDAFLTKFDGNGTQLWTQNVGAKDGNERGYSVAVDDSGNVYLVGTTDRDLGGTNAGGKDVFIAKIDSEGTVLWIRQLGSSGDDYGDSLAVDNQEIVLFSSFPQGDLGLTARNTFLKRFDKDGNELWSQQVGSSGKALACFAVDNSGNIITVVTTSLPVSVDLSEKRFVSLVKFNRQGEEIWSQQIEASDGFYHSSIAADSYGNTYLTGFKKEKTISMEVEDTDAFLTKFNRDGKKLWSQRTHPTRASFIPRVRSLATNNAGDVYLAGSTSGDLEGTNAGGEDAFLMKLSNPSTVSSAGIAVE